VFFGITSFSQLKFIPLLSFPLFIANGLVGDFGFGEIGGVNEVVVVEVLFGIGSGSGESDFGVNFLIEFLLSRFGTTWLHVG
jgi:hypothetical protein